MLRSTEGDSGPQQGTERGSGGPDAVPDVPGLTRTPEEQFEELPKGNGKGKKKRPA